MAIRTRLGRLFRNTASNVGTSSFLKSEKIVEETPMRDSVIITASPGVTVALVKDAPCAKPSPITNINYSLVGSVAAYLMAFVMAPFICTVFLGTNLLQPQQLLISLAELIAAPFIVSRILRLTRIAPWLEKYRGTIVNWGFFLVIYTIIGLNRGAFLEQPDALLRLSVVAFACTFAIAYVINRISKVLGAAKPNRISLAVLGAWKNYGLAGAIALTFFSSKAAMPAAVTTAFAILNFIWLTFWTKKSG